MGAFNTAHGEGSCPACGEIGPFSVQFRFGDTWQHAIAVGDALPWGGNDVGRPGLGEVRVLGIGGPCLRCGADDLDFEVVVIDDVVTALRGATSGPGPSVTRGSVSWSRDPSVEQSTASTQGGRLNPDDVEAWIARAPFHEVLRAVRRGLSHRRDAVEDGAFTYLHGLALAANDGEGWELSMAAEADVSAYEGSPPDGEPWCQFGACPGCGLELTAAVKRASCPACGASVRLT